jgi:hypothetical protein
VTDHRVTDWIKATASNANGSCVEMRRNGSVVEIRDTKQNGSGPTLAFTPAVFAAWVEGASRGEYNDLM